MDLDYEVKEEPDSSDENDCMIEMEIFNDCAAIKREFEAEGLAAAVTPQVKQETDDRKDWFHNGKERGPGFEIITEQPIKAEGVSAIPEAIIKLHRLEDVGYQVSNVAPVEEPVKEEPDSSDENDCMIEMEIFNDCAAIKREFEAEGLAAAVTPQVKQETDDRKDWFHNGKERGPGFEIITEQPITAEGVSAIPEAIIKLHGLEDLGYQVSNVAPVEEPVKVEPDSSDEDDCMVEMEIFNDCAAIKREFEAEGLAAAVTPQVKQETDDRKDWFHNGKERGPGFEIITEQPIKAEGVSAIPEAIINLHGLEDLGYQVSNVAPVEEPVLSSYCSSLAEEDVIDTEEEEEEEEEEQTECKEYIVKYEDSLEDEGEEEDDDVDDPEPVEQAVDSAKEMEQDQDKGRLSTSRKDVAEKGLTKKMTKREYSHCCMYCDYRTFQKTDPDRHERTHTGKKPYKCTTCNKKFSLTRSLVVHQRTHSGEKPYKCTTCNKKFSLKRSLVVHQRIHSGEKPYKCTTCNKKFSQQGSLIKHERTHSGDKPYKCTICNKKFSQQGNLIKHERTHSGKKPYKCTTCNKKFSQQGNLIRHERTHSGDKHYKCTTCNKKFSQQGHLIVHERTHSGDKPYKCTTCNKKFSQQGHLIVHERTHSGDKPYKCTTCNKKFSRKGHLIVHERTHSGDKPYKCTTCNKKFSRKDSLNRHERTHSGE